MKPLARRKTPVVAPAEPAAAKEPAPFAEKSRLSGRLAAGQWVATVELVPPRGYDLASIAAKSKWLRECGVDAINIPDGPRRARASPR